MPDIFNQNLQCLEMVMPSLASRLREIQLPTSIELLRAESGDWTAKQTLTDGSYRFLHSRIDPKHEAKIWVKSQYIATPSIVILGIGLAYHVFHMFRHNNIFQNVCLIEADEKILRLAMTVIDFSSLLQNRIVHLVVGASPVFFPTVQYTPPDLPFSLYIFNPIVASNPAAYMPAAKLLEQHLYSIRSRNNPGITTLLNYMSTP